MSQYFSDPDRAFLMKQSDDCRAEDSLPVCEDCGISIDTEDCYEIDGNLYCRDCIEKNIRYGGRALWDDDLYSNNVHECEWCGRELTDCEYGHEPFNIEGEIICKKCLQDEYLRQTRDFIYGIA